MTFGESSFLELLSSSREQPGAVESLLSARPVADNSLFKIAQVLSPSDPYTSYEQLGGKYVTAGVKIAKDYKQPAGGLKRGVTLFQHQQEAVDKIIAKDGNLLLSHPTGSGKTLSAIAAFEEMRKRGMAHRALVVAPASLRTNFMENGVKRFTNSTASIFGNAQEAVPGTHVTVDHPGNADYHIVSYDLFRTDPKKYIDAAKADTVIYDELHRAKNQDALITKAIKDARPFHRNFIGMTGSIVSNTPADIVPLVDAMTDGHHLLGNKTTFESRFVETKEDGSKKLRNPQVLRALLSPYVHHVTPEELNTKAPKKIIEEVRVDMSPHQAQLYNFILDKLDPITKLRLKAGVSSLNGMQLNDMFAKMLRLRQVSNSIHTMDTGLTLEQSAEGTPKVKRILDDVVEHLHETPDGQVVVHTNMIQGGIDVLHAGFKARGIEPAIFIGKGNPGITEKYRQQGVKDFQEGKKKVILLSAAGGEGLDLPNTTFMAMMDGHFNPERISQAEARGIRAGGQAKREEDKRQVIVRRYVSVLPKGVEQKAQVLANIWDNISPNRIIKRINAGGEAFYNPWAKTPSTDEWIYGVAKRKSGLNSSLHETIKTSSAASSCTTHEEFEHIFMEKVAKWTDTVNRGAKFLLNHPNAIGGLAGAGYGFLTGGTGPRTKMEAMQDPNAPLRNRIASTVGGAISGSLVLRPAINAMIRSKNVYTAIPALSAGFLGPAAAVSIADLFAPRKATPKSLRDILGENQKSYSDKRLFEKYWEKFGPELERKGLEGPVSDTKTEQQFVRALKDLYVDVGGVRPNLFGPAVTGKHTQDKVPSKTRFALTRILPGVVMTGVTGAGSVVMQLGAGSNVPETIEAALAGALPVGASLAGGIAKSYRENYIDPSTTSVSSRAEVRKRAKFNEEQLLQLLRGKSVDEIKVKSHYIK